MAYRIDILRIILSVICMAAFLAALAVGFWLYASSGRHFAGGVVYIAPRTSDGRAYFSRADVDFLPVVLPGHAVAGLSRRGIFFTSSTREASATLIHAPEAYFMMQAPALTEGSVHGGYGSLVINEALAWQLFGSAYNVLGVSVWQGDVQLRVGGVLAMGDEPTAWAITSHQPTTAPISSLYIQSENSNPLAGATAQAVIRTRLNRNPADFAIIVTDRLSESIGMRTRILMYVAWAIVLAFAAVSVMRGVAKKKFIQGAAGGLVAGVALFILRNGVNSILLWLPNPEATDIGVIAYILGRVSMPAEPYISESLSALMRLSDMASVVLILGLFALAGLTACVYTVFNSNVKRGDRT